MGEGWKARPGMVRIEAGLPPGSAPRPSPKADWRGQCVVCFTPCNRLSFGIDKLCYMAGRYAGRADLDEWVPFRRRSLGYRD